MLALYFGMCCAHLVYMISVDNPEIEQHTFDLAVYIQMSEYRYTYYMITSKYTNTLLWTRKHIRIARTTPITVNTNTKTLRGKKNEKKK